VGGKIHIVTGPNNSGSWLIGGFACGEPSPDALSTHCCWLAWCFAVAAVGKTVYLKQVGIIVYLAHTGCFVPAAQATIGICDRILTRLKSVESATREGRDKT